ncbi:MAG: hypothetical protein WA628_04850 [Terriglobales bacterium]
MKPFFGYALLLAAVASTTVTAGIPEPRVVEVIAASDNTFRVPHEKSPVIRAKPGEPLRLRITSQRGSEQARDGATHSLVIRALRDQGWDLRLYDGTKDYDVKAPETPAEYLVECTVKCGRGHDDMRMKLIVAR